MRTSLQFMVSAFLLLFSLNCVVLAQNEKLTTLLQKAPSTPNAISYLNVPALAKLVTDENIPALNGTVEISSAQKSSSGRSKFSVKSRSSSRVI